MANYLITKAGRKVLVQDGQAHKQTCEDILHTTLEDFIENGGVRVKIHGEHAAVESHVKLNSQQIGKVNGILRNNDIFSLVTSFAKYYEDIRTSFTRPIRKLSLRG